MKNKAKVSKQHSESISKDATLKKNSSKLSNKGKIYAQEGSSGGSALRLSSP